MTELTVRQLSEIRYHEEHANRHRDRLEQAVNFDCIEDSERRPWNAFWSTYDIVLRHDLRGKRVLVPGCGFGEDAVRFAELGADVYAFDISADVIEVARKRAEAFGYSNIRFDVFPSESMAYEDDFFDAVFFIDILHHVDIPATMREIRRVMKNGGWIIGDELYTHSWVQRHLRENALVSKILHPLMTRYIYNDSKPYITEFEHKIDQDEFAHVVRAGEPKTLDYFYIFVGRVIPERYLAMTRLDRLLTRFLGGIGKYLAGRVIFEIRLQK
jgi:ubiquinone/menaquinone biosynthesis C-methylase UbiE